METHAGLKPTPCARNRSAPPPDDARRAAPDNPQGGLSAGPIPATGSCEVPTSS
jgi:hypothetical protein